MDFKLLLDGALVDGAALLEVINPATASLLAMAPRADSAQVDMAVAAARRASFGWARLSYAERGALLMRLADALDARREEFAHLLTQEQGKPLADAAGELGGAAATLRWCAAQELKPTVLRETDAELIIDQHYPLGVVLAICPWNYPMAILTSKVGPALITGNVVIAKPAPTTPLTALLFGELVADILPAGVFQTIVDNNDLGDLLSSHPGVDFVSFTGSTATGKKVLGSTTETIKRFSLELGGNDAALILPDADPETAAPKIFAAATKNAGQICLAVKRVYAPRQMVDQVCDIFGRLADATVVGDGLSQSTTMGPVQNRAQYEKLIALLEESRAEGTIVAGGEIPELPGYFIRPTVVRDLSDEARLVREEQFGPLLPVLAYDDLEEAIERINATEYGLGGSVWTADPKMGVEVAARIASGTVWVNRHLGLAPDIPFGGAKQSGLGRQQGIRGLEEFTQGRIISVART
ncbi:aldehyde dehydrogenase family protein [Sphingobium sp.]|uniref:aldehyde dehydrogenase family protein n=1 Tax=Sphingobium sp. TaxID=1912891 RepID=UPI002C74A55B|nr:aldehyde dehydrogenase family protein [Sphingobium sp.]HUD90652.1 aldehyde dehydrogenase family protein [Sphingobium sp.]